MGEGGGAPDTRQARLAGQGRHKVCAQGGGAAGISHLGRAETTVPPRCWTCRAVPCRHAGWGMRTCIQGAFLEDVVVDVLVRHSTHTAAFP